MWDPNRVRSSVLVWLLSPHYFTCINTVTLIALTSTTPKQSEPWKKKKMRWKKQADGKKRTKRKNKSWVMSHDSWLQPRWNITFYNKNLEGKKSCLKSISGVCRIVFIWRKKKLQWSRELIEWLCPVKQERVKTFWLLHRYKMCLGLVCSLLHTQLKIISCFEEIHRKI